MGKSVKLNDGSYIDAEGVWDNALGMTQQDANSTLSTKLANLDGLYFKNIFPAKVGNFTVTVQTRLRSPILLIIDQNCYTDLYLVNQQEIVTLHAQSKYTTLAKPTITVPSGTYRSIIKFGVIQWGRVLVISGVPFTATYTIDT